MNGKPKSVAKYVNRGKFQQKIFRPTAIDLASLDVLSHKLRITEANVIRIGLARLVEFEGVRDLVAKKATLLESGAVSSAG